MVYVSGILLILLGGVLFHVASSDSNISSPLDIWKDILKTMQVGE